jgi:hypothetical protein
MSEPIKIEVPKSEIEFDLGGNIFKLSLADKSRARINEKYRVIAQAELLNNQHIAAMERELSEKLSNIKSNLSDSEAKKRESAISNDYDRKFKQAADKAEEIANAQYLPFVDVLFGDGAGDRVYHICGENIIAVNKVIAIVMTNLNNENDVTDYMAEYAKSIERQNAILEGGDASDSDK